MQNFQLSVLLKILGIGAASGIVNYNNSLYIISDNSGFLYQYQLENKQLITHSLVENATANTIKSKKPDFEAITLKENDLHIFSSGSKENRCKKVVFNLENKQIQETSFVELYKNIKKSTSISDNELNIEGAFYYNNDLFLFQRGNGAKSRNGIIKINENQEIDFCTLILPKIKHLETTFTDAILVDKTIYFLASAENTESTYDDGEVLGSILGTINIDTLEIESSIQISNNQKFEGIALESKTKTEIHFLLCQDDDTELLETIIYKLKIQL